MELGSTDSILYYTDSVRLITLGFGTRVDREVTKSLEVGVGIRIYKDDDNFVQGIIETIQHLSLYSRITLEADTRVVIGSFSTNDDVSLQLTNNTFGYSVTVGRITYKLTHVTTVYN